MAKSLAWVLEIISREYLTDCRVPLTWEQFQRVTRVTWRPNEIGKG